jgi:hypothetical protein
VKYPVLIHQTIWVEANDEGEASDKAWDFIYATVKYGSQHDYSVTVKEPQEIGEQQ